MAESQTTFDMLAYKHDADTDMAGVMPDHWAGHARIAAMQATEGLSQEARQTAREKAHAVAQNNPDVSAEAIGKAARQYVEKHIL